MGEHLGTGDCIVLKNTASKSPELIWQEVKARLPIDRNTTPDPTSPAETPESASPPGETPTTPAADEPSADPPSAASRSRPRAQPVAEAEGGRVRARASPQRADADVPGAPHAQESGAPIWRLLLQAIQSGAFGPPDARPDLGAESTARRCRGRRSAMPISSTSPARSTAGRRRRPGRRPRAPGDRAEPGSARRLRAGALRADDGGAGAGAAARGAARRGPGRASRCTANSSGRIRRATPAMDLRGGVSGVVVLRVLASAIPPTLGG